MKDELMTISQNTADTLVAVPPVGIASLALFGMSIPEWILVLTLIHISLAIAWKLWHIYKEIRDGRCERDTTTPA